MIVHKGSLAQWEVGDCRETLRMWAAQGLRARTCITSPPYFGLRDYGHDGQLGLEATPKAYVTAMVGVFREVRDVLTDDGTLWLNIGDSYAGSGRGGYPGGKSGLEGTTVGQDSSREAAKRSRNEVSSQPLVAATTGVGNRMRGTEGLKQKDLIGIPWMLAFALRADGWYLRDEIVWAKSTSGLRREGNVMPESVRDRCTKAHEKIFLFAKSERYYFDAEAIKEPAQDWGPRDRSKMRGGTTDPKLKHGGLEDASHAMGNRRNVWRANTSSYKGAHFAVYPPALIEPCVLAGSSAGAQCPKCRAPFLRQVERTAMVINKTVRNEERGTRTGTSGTMVEPARSRTSGWNASCECGAGAVSDFVLDPFGGSGTTGGVALKHGRHALLCELNAEYAALMPDRIRAICS